MVNNNSIKNPLLFKHNHRIFYYNVLYELFCEYRRSIKLVTDVKRSAEIVDNISRFWSLSVHIYANEVYEVKTKDGSIINEDGLLNGFYYTKKLMRVCNKYFLSQCKLILPKETYSNIKKESRILWRELFRHNIFDKLIVINERRIDKCNKSSDVHIKLTKHTNDSDSPDYCNERIFSDYWEEN